MREILLVNKCELRSIHTGEIAKETVNVDNSREIGETIISSMEGKDVTSYVFRKKDKAITMDFSKSTVSIDKEIISVDPQLLFQRLVASVQIGAVDCDPKLVFSYELSTFPLSMFDSDGLMRDAKPKTEIVKELKRYTTMNHVKLPDTTKLKYVVDGGYLLHKVSWEKGSTYDEN